MKKGITKQIGTAKQTTLVGYFLAALVAVQPLLDTEVDWSKPVMVVRYAVKLLFAAGIAVLGRYVATHTGAKNLHKKSGDSGL